MSNNQSAIGSQFQSFYSLFIPFHPTSNSNITTKDRLKTNLNEWNKTFPSLPFRLLVIVISALETWLHKIIYFYLKIVLAKICELRMVCLLFRLDCFTLLFQSQSTCSSIAWHVIANQTANQQNKRPRPDKFFAAMQNAMQCYLLDM